MTVTDVFQLLFFFILSALFYRKSPFLLISSLKQIRQFELANFQTS